MEDVIAIEVRLADGGARYFLTWGRIQHSVDTEPVCALVMRAAPSFSLQGKPISARVCDSLREAAESNSAPYFYEGLLRFCQRPIPFGDSYEQWRAQTAQAMADGKALYYCGTPVNRTHDEAD